MYEASSDARKETALATSSGFPNRLIVRAGVVDRDVRALRGQLKRYLPADSP